MACNKSKLYEHHPLDPVRRQIRTLHVIPGHGNQSISIKLKVQDLEDPSTKYIALSYVWGTETASEVFQADGENIQVTHYHDLPGYSIVGSADARFKENTEFLALWEMFLSVASSAWWTRAWTVQEAVVPKDSVLRLGKWSINFETVIKSRQLRNCHLPECCKSSLLLLPALNRMALDEFLSRVDWIERFREPDPVENRPLGPQSWPKTFPEFRCRPFYELVLTFSNRACSNPRDKVFSLLAFAKSPVMKAHRPDYSRSVIDTYT
ncbi:hypothetical protein PG988_010963 [Apiospora saccharicola]